MCVNIWQVVMILVSLCKICKPEFCKLKFSLLSAFLFFLIIMSFLVNIIPCIANTGAAKITDVDKTDKNMNDLCITKFAHGSVNWHTGKVQAKGRACPSDKKRPESSDYILSAAKADASHNLSIILKKIGSAAMMNNDDYKISHKNSYQGKIGDDKISDSASSQDTIMAGIETIASNAKVIEQHYTSDRAMEVTIETSILGGFLQLVLPDSIREIPKINFIGSCCKETEVKNSQNKDKAKFTGLIINAKGLSFHPVIYPVVLSEMGKKIYSSMFISREYAVQWGVCGYACTMEEALNSKKAGKNPIIIKGLRKGGPDNSSIIISSHDAEKIERATEHYSFMKKCKVVILLN